MDDLDKERLRFNLEIIKLLTLLLITIGGGFVALFAESLAEANKTYLVAFGIRFSLLCGIMGIVVYENSLKKLR